MPTYEYACKTCNEHVEVVQSFKDDPLTTCPACGGPLRKVFGSIGISFKGSGFYKTDSRKADAATGSTDKPAKSDKADKADKADSSSDKTTAAPAASSSDQRKKAAAS